MEKGSQIETPDPNLSLGMRNLNSAYTQSFNRRHKRVGHVFQGRYKSIIVEKNAHLLELCRYVVLNPVRAHMVTKPGDWNWSSYNSTANNEDPLDFLTIDWILGQFSLKKMIAQENYRKFVESGIEDKTDPWDSLKGQVFFGSEEFIHSIKVSGQ